MTFTDKQLLWLAGGGAVLVVLAGMYARHAAGQVAQAVKEGARHVNPVDQRNVFNRMHEWWWQNTVGRTTGQTEGGIGIWLADVINPPGKWAD